MTGPHVTALDETAAIPRVLEDHTLVRMSQCYTIEEQDDPAEHNRPDTVRREHLTESWYCMDYAGNANRTGRDASIQYRLDGDVMHERRLKLVIQVVKGQDATELD